MKYWILRNMKPVLGISYFFTSEYTLMDYLQDNNYSNITIVWGMLAHILLFVTFLIIIKFEQDSGIDLYNPPAKTKISPKKNIVEEEFTARIDKRPEYEPNDPTQVQN